MSSDDFGYGQIVTDKDLTPLTRKTVSSIESLLTEIEFSSLFAVKSYTLIELKEMALKEKTEIEVTAFGTELTETTKKRAYASFDVDHNKVLSKAKIATLQITLTFSLIRICGHTGRQE